MKLYTRRAELPDITYLRNNGMYQATIKYMTILKEYGVFERSPWTATRANGVVDDCSATIIVFRQVDKDDEDREIAKGYHKFNFEDYIRLPFDTDKDIALVLVDDRGIGELSFIFHENGTGEYNEIRYIYGIRNLFGTYSCVEFGEI